MVNSTSNHFSFFLSCIAMLGQNGYNFFGVKHAIFLINNVKFNSESWTNTVNDPPLKTKLFLLSTWDWTYKKISSNEISSWTDCFPWGFQLSFALQGVITGNEHTINLKLWCCTPSVKKSIGASNNW